MELTASVAARLPPKVRDLVGFEMHGSLGFFDNTIHDAHTDEGTSAMMREDGTVREGAAPELDGVLGKLAAGEIGVAEAKDEGPAGEALKARRSRSIIYWRYVFVCLD